MHRTRQSEEIINQAILRFTENTERIDKCLRDLSEEEVWQKPNKSSNSMGNLILHLCGNITQYIISSLGEKADNRDRDREFISTGGLNKAELMQKLSDTVNQAIEVLENLSDADLLKERFVQGFDYSGTGSVIHVVEHYSYHTGQIAFWTKVLRDKDLGFYAGVDLNIKNKPADD